MKTCTKCGSKPVAVQYDLMDKYHYDGVSEYMCVNPECRYRQGRWCEEELSGPMMEPPFCTGGGHPRVIDLTK